MKEQKIALSFESKYEAENYFYILASDNIFNKGKTHMNDGFKRCYIEGVEYMPTVNWRKFNNGETGIYLDRVNNC